VFTQRHYLYINTNPLSVYSLKDKESDRSEVTVDRHAKELVHEWTETHSKTGPSTNKHISAYIRSMDWHNTPRIITLYNVLTNQSISGLIQRFTPGELMDWLCRVRLVCQGVGPVTCWRVNRPHWQIDLSVDDVTLISVCTQIRNRPNYWSIGKQGKRRHLLTSSVRARENRHWLPGAKN